MMKREIPSETFNFEPFFNPLTKEKYKKNPADEHL